MRFRQLAVLISRVPTIIATKYIPFRQSALLHTPGITNMAANIDPLTATASDLQEWLINDTVTSQQLVKLYLHQVAQYNGYLRAVIAVAPEDQLLEAAKELDHERAKGNTRGPLHGIPILIKVMTFSGEIIIV